MITKLHSTVLVLFGTLLLPLALMAQISDQSMNSQETLPPLVCEAPIDPSWLQQARTREITGSDFDEPIVRVAYLIPSNRSPQPKGGRVSWEFID